jgi:hypothetical protein
MVEQMKGVMATQKDGLLKQMRDIIPVQQSDIVNQY